MLKVMYSNIEDRKKIDNAIREFLRIHDLSHIDAIKILLQSHGLCMSVVSDFDVTKEDYLKRVKSLDPEGDMKFMLFVALNECCTDCITNKNP